MPQQTLPSGQDWETQNAGRGTGGRRMTVPTSGRELERAKAMGLVTTEKRQQAGGANTHASTIMSARALDDATEAGRIVKVDVKLSKAIAQARTSMKLSQKDLAASINTTPNLIAQYENGSAIPDNRIIQALERKLNTKLPRPGKSKPPPNDAGSSGAKTTQSKATSGGVTRGGPPKRR